MRIKNQLVLGLQTDFFDIDYAYFNNQFDLGKSTQISLIFKNI